MKKICVSSNDWISDFDEQIIFSIRVEPDLGNPTIKIGWVFFDNLDSETCSVNFFKTKSTKRKLTNTLFKFF